MKQKCYFNAAHFNLTSVSPPGFCKFHKTDVLQKTKKHKNRNFELLKRFLTSISQETYQCVLPDTNLD